MTTVTTEWNDQTTSIINHSAPLTQTSFSYRAETMAYVSNPHLSHPNKCSKHLQINRGEFHKKLLSKNVFLSFWEILKMVRK